MSLQTLELSETDVRLHIDIYSAQTGISRCAISKQCLVHKLFCFSLVSIKIVT